MELLKRIDLALTKSGKTRAELARELGISTQAITSLAYRPNATMKHENLERAAAALGCDLTWLKTGKGSYRLRGDAKQALFISHTSPDTDHDPAALQREMRASTVVWAFSSLPSNRQDYYLGLMTDEVSKLLLAKA